MFSCFSLQLQQFEAQTSDFQKVTTCLFLDIPFLNERQSFPLKNKEKTAGIEILKSTETSNACFPPTFLFSFFKFRGFIYL